MIYKESIMFKKKMDMNMNSNKNKINMKNIKNNMTKKVNWNLSI